MPQPIYPQPPNGTFPYRARILLSKRPHHAAGIGLVVAEWAALEEQLIQTLVLSLFAFSKEGGYDIARTMLDTIDSITIRLEVIGAILKTRIPADAYTFFDNDLRREIRHRSTERNRIVHGNWCVDDHYPDDVITRIDGRYVKYTVKDFTDIAERIIATTQKATQFLAQFQRWDGEGPWRQEPVPQQP
jgi:hypothetical protein